MSVRVRPKESSTFTERLPNLIGNLQLKVGPYTESRVVSYK